MLVNLEMLSDDINVFYVDVFNMYVYIKFLYNVLNELENVE